MTYRVGFAGLQRGGGLVSAFAHTPRAEVAAFCDLDLQLLADLGRGYGVPDGQLYTSYDDLVNAPIDIVVIATPIQYHAEQAIKAVESGKWVDVPLFEW